MARIFKQNEWKNNIQSIKDQSLKDKIENNPLQTYTSDDVNENYDSYLLKDYSNIEVSLPKEFNGKEIWKSRFTDIENQKNCGSCWAFATVKTLEDRMNIQSNINPKIELSPARSILCDIGSYNHILDIQKETEYRKNSSCYGNTIFDGLKYLYEVGSVLDKCIPYDLKNNLYYKPINEFQNIQDLPFCETIASPYYDMCYNWYFDPRSPQFQGTPARFFRISSFYKLKNEEEMMKDIYLYGPIVSGFDVYDSFYTFDPTKEIYEYDGKGVLTGGHAIEIVGWGEENGKKFWWVKNSWGQDWGIDGYFKIIRGNNNCNIENNAWSLIPDFYYNMNQYVPKQLIEMLPELNFEKSQISKDLGDYGYTKRTEIFHRELDNQTNIFNLQDIKDFYNRKENFVSFYKPKSYLLFWVIVFLIIIIFLLI